MGVDAQSMDAASIEALMGVRESVATLTGRLDQVLIDHKQQLAQNAADIAQEKKDRSEDVRRLHEKFEAHTDISTRERATLAANVKDLQADSAEYRAKLNNAWSKILQGGAALAAIGALFYSIWSGTQR